MSDFKVELPFQEWSALVKKAGFLRGLIEAHEVLTGDDVRPQDEVMWRLAKEGDDEVRVES